MIPSSFSFSIQAKHNLHSGSAVIVEMHYDVSTRAEEAFKNDGDQRPVTVRLIGNVVGPSQPGYKEYYDIYESYTDSGSDDYYYFAVPTHAQEL